MRWALIVLFACGKSSAPPVADRWGEVEKAAADLVPAAESSKLRATLDRVSDDDVPEVAIEELFAWAEARGGWIKRGDRSIHTGDPILKVNRIATAALERRATDPRTLPAVLYLAQRLRGEGGCLLDSMVGFDLYAKASVLGPAPADRAPTEAEIRRAIAIDAVCAKAMLDEAAKQDPDESEVARNLRRTTERALQELVVDLPADIRAAPAHAAKVTAKYKEHPMASMVISDRLERVTQSMLDVLDGKQTLPSAAQP